MHVRTLLAPLVSMLVLLGAGFAQPAAAQRAPDPSYVAQRSLALSQLSVEATNVAARRAQSRDVRAFADDANDRFAALSRDIRNLVDDADLQPVAKQYSFDKEMQAMLDRLSNAEGRDVDRAFLRLQQYVADNLVEVYQDAADGTRNDRVRRFAQNQLNALRDQRRRLERLADAER